MKGVGNENVKWWHLEEDKWNNALSYELKTAVDCTSFATDEDAVERNYYK
jgi:hypothetical protein